MPAGSFLIDWQVLPKIELVRSEYHNDFLLPRDIHAVLGLMAWRNERDVAIMSLTRSPRQPDYQTGDAERLAPFMPHIRRAVALARRLPSRLLRAPDLDVLIDAWQEGVLLLDEAGRVLYANQAAERLLARLDGLRLARASSRRPSRWRHGGSPQRFTPRRSVAGFGARVSPCREGPANVRTWCWSCHPAGRAGFCTRPGSGRYSR